MIAFVLLVAACGKDKNPLEEARRQQEEEYKNRESVAAPKKLRPPVPGETKLPCAQVMNVDAFQTALAETEPLTLKDVTPKNDGDVTASCDLVRGGKKLTDAEQQALIKKEGRLGILSGDVVCNVRLLCTKLESEQTVRDRCARAKERADESMGTFACVQVVATGVYDVEVYKFFDEDTKCLIEVRGGPSNTDNSTIRTCATTARDTIGPPQIAVGPDGKPVGAPPAQTGSATGSATGSDVGPDQ